MGGGFDAVYIESGEGVDMLENGSELVFESSQFYFAQIETSEFGDAFERNFLIGHAGFYLLNGRFKTLFEGGLLRKKGKVLV